MRRYGALLLPLASLVALAGAPVRAADVDETSEYMPPAPPLQFGELRTWANGITTTRVPAELQALREPGNRAMIPPRVDRTPWQARLSAALEADDNLLLATDHRRKGAALIVTPGLNWQQESARHRIEMDASAELLHGVQGDYDAKRLDASTLQASAIARSSETTAVSYFGTLLRSHDPAGNTPAVPVPGGPPDQRFAASYQRHELDAGWRTGPRTDVAARWVGTWASSHAPDYVRTRAHDIELAAHWRYDALLRLGVLLRERRADFEDRPNARPNARYGAAWLEAERQWSATLVSRGAIGAAQGNGPSMTVWRASLTQTYAIGQWDLALERDVTAPAGLGRLYEMRGARIGAALRVGDRGRIEVAWVGAEYRPIGFDPGGFGSVRTLRPRVTGTLPLDARTWLSMRYQGIDDRVVDNSLQRQGDRLLVTLLRTI
jgi:hypothetical protein